MDISCSRMYLVGGVLAGGTIAAIALAEPFAIQSSANPLTTLTQFFPNTAPISSRGAELFVSTQRDTITISILARGFKTKSNPQNQKETPDSPRHGVPGGGS